MHPVTKYAKSGDVHVAYQVIGNGPLDLVLVPGWASHIEYAWEWPSYAHLLERLTSFSRLIWFDKRGTGLSDRVAELPTLEQRMDDLRAVMDAASSKKAAVFGVSEGGSMSALFAATYPERTTALVLCGSFAKRQWDPEYPWAPTVEEREKWISEIEKGWGGAVEVSSLAPSMAANDSFCEWFTTYGKLSVSPGAAVALARMNTYIDIRQVLPSIHVPTLIIHSVGDRDVKIGNGRYLAEHIPGARLVELTGEDHLAWIIDPDPIADVVQEFLTGVRPSPPIDRVLTTILFTDIVRSTDRATRMGDQDWRRLLLKHNELVRKELSHFRGREVKTTGDGFLATFDGPARAIKCAEAIRASLAPLGIEIRAGLHTGECELLGDDIGGVAVHIAARVLEKAGKGEIVASSTVKDLVSGSGTRFQERGWHTFKGVQGRWRLFRVISGPS